MIDERAEEATDRVQGAVRTLGEWLALARKRRQVPNTCPARRARAVASRVPLERVGAAVSSATVCGAVQVYVPPRNRSFGTIDALALVGLVGFAVARWVPLARIVPFWGCGFRKVTGIPCPGCGLTRVADRFAHLNILGALKANPLGTVAAALFAAAIVASFVHLTFKVPVPELVLDDREWTRVRWAAVLLFCVNYAWVVFAYTQLKLF